MIAYSTMSVINVMVDRHVSSTTKSGRGPFTELNSGGYGWTTRS